VAYWSNRCREYHFAVAAARRSNLRVGLAEALANAMIYGRTRVNPAKRVRVEWS
jgi:hypothetical protein